MKVKKRAQGQCPPFPWRAPAVTPDGQPLLQSLLITLTVVQATLQEAITFVLPNLAVLPPMCLWLPSLVSLMDLFLATRGRWDFADDGSSEAPSLDHGDELELACRCDCNPHRDLSTSPFAYTLTPISRTRAATAS